MSMRILCWFFLLSSILSAAATASDNATSPVADGRYLYVATPGVRNDLQYGGHGLVVFDIDNGHRFVKRIATGGLDAKGKPLNVKGVCASAKTGRIYVSTLQHLLCIDLATEQLVWENRYSGGCDRMSITPDGKTIYTPSLEGAHWNIIDAKSGEVIKKITPNSGAHNTVVALDGKFAFLAGLRSPLLTVVDTTSNEVVKTVGPFAAAIRPFTVNGSSTLCFVTINELLGFEIGDIETGKKLHRVEVRDYKTGAVKRHGCPSHGIALSPDEKEIWVTDACNQRLHIFDLTVMPPKQLESVKLKDEPGWVTFSLDGRYVYPSTGDVIEAQSRNIIAELKDETGAAVQSEKMIEIDYAGGKPVRNGDQFGVGRVSANKSPLQRANEPPRREGCETGHATSRDLAR